MQIHKPEPTLSASYIPTTVCFPFPLTSGAEDGQKGRPPPEANTLPAATRDTEEEAPQVLTMGKKTNMKGKEKQMKAGDMP